MLHRHDRSTASSLSHIVGRGLLNCPPEGGWSRAPSVSYGSHVCAFGARQFAFGPRERKTFRLAPVLAAPLERHCPFLFAHSPEYRTPSPTPETRFEEWDRRSARFLVWQTSPRRHPGVHLHVTLTVGDTPGPLAKMLLRARGHWPSALP